MDTKTAERIASPLIIAREAELERRLELEGGRVTGADGAQITFRWANKINPYDYGMTEGPIAETLARHREILRGLRTIKTRARRAPRPDHARARAALEARGELGVLGYETRAKRRPMVLRIWYRSIGDEILVVDSAPMTAPDAVRGVQDPLNPSAFYAPGWFAWALHVEVLHAHLMDPIEPPAMYALPEEARRRWAGVTVGHSHREATRLLKTAPREARGVVFPDRIVAWGGDAELEADPGI